MNNEDTETMDMLDPGLWQLAKECIAAGLDLGARALEPSTP